jgi:UDP-N-acetylmuramate dehydrogenase
MANRIATPLAELTTLRLGGPAKRLVEVHDEAALLAEVTGCDERGEPVLVLGGGSNVVIPDDGFDGTVVLVRIAGVRVDDDGCGGVTAMVAPGEDWDAFVVRAIDEGWRGVECLSGIPGLVGAVPMQNVGAYGQEVADCIASVRTYDRSQRRQVTYAAGDCGFGYRTSRFKQEPDRHLVLGVTFQFALGDRSAPIGYAELARRLDATIGSQLPSIEVRQAVLQLRRGKGMVLDPADHDTWSAGSFFTNPILDPAEADRLPADAPRWPVDGGRVKTSAAWLIERAGYHRGYGDGTIRLSSKHTLALTNRGDGTAVELLALAREIRDGVAAKFGVQLDNEPVLVGGLEL